MKDFSETIDFVRYFNSFCELIPQLWHNDKNKLHPGKIGELISNMKEYQKATALKGEELANEVKNVCNDVLELKHYYTPWESILDDLSTIWMNDEDFFNRGIWETKLGDYFLAQDVVALLEQMKANYVDVMNSKWNLKRMYGLFDEEPHSVSESRTMDNKPLEEAHADGDNGSVPGHDVLRLFGCDNKKYQEYIEACKGHAPKEVARLYKYKYGKIQVEQEKGIVTQLHKHLKDIGILYCTLRNFQRHYKLV